jgi:hypothetical protein
MNRIFIGVINNENLLKWENSNLILPTPVESQIACEIGLYNIEKQGTGRI